MAVRIRLTRVGATKRPSYRVVAIDRRRARDGRALEILGFYDPLTDPATVRLETDRIKAWIGRGAQPSETVVKLMRQAEGAGTATKAAAKPARKTTRTRKPKAAAAETAAEATAEPTEATAADEPGTAAAAESADEPSEAPAADEATEKAEA